MAIRNLIYGIVSKKFWLFLSFVCGAVLTLSQVTVAREYHLSMLPLYSTEEIHNRIVPIAEYLSKETGLDIKPVLTVDFTQYIQKAKSGAIDIGYQNPYVYVKISDKHDAIAMALSGGRGDKFRGIIITRTDSPIVVLGGIKGKKVSIVGRTSAGGFLSQNYTLMRHGINIFEDCSVEEAAENKQENVILSVHAGEADVGFIRETAFKKVRDFFPERSLRILYMTQWLPNWALSLNRNIPQKDREKIINAIKALRRGNPALTALKVDGFVSANDKAYNVVREAAGIKISDKE